VIETANTAFVEAMTTTATLAAAAAVIGALIAVAFLPSRSRAEHSRSWAPTCSSRP
jgi:hypothetical protein